MFFLKRQIRFLHFYFILLGLVLFAAHYFNIAEKYSLLLSGPAIYLATHLDQLISRFIELPKDQNTLELVLLLPTHIFYFGSIGFLFRQIFTEKGFIKMLTILMLLGFLGFVHFVSWRALTLYLSAHPLIPELAVS